MTKVLRSLSCNEKGRRSSGGNSTLGVQSDGYVHVTAGLVAGERVVTTGAYRVHLASLSSELPAHGHAH